MAESAGSGGSAASPESTGAERSARSPQRRRFGTVVVVGLAGAGLLAVSGTRDWSTVEITTDGRTAQITAAATGETSLQAPLVTALGLVLLACWGVILVTRGRFRRVVAVVAASAGLAAFGVALAEQLDRPDLDLAMGQTAISGSSGWAWVGLFAACAAMAATLAAVREVPHWPEMGSRYDAPQAGAAPAERPAEEQSSLELWKAMDEGHDPTR